MSPKYCVFMNLDRGTKVGLSPEVGVLGGSAGCPHPFSGLKILCPGWTRRRGTLVLFTKLSHVVLVLKATRSREAAARLCEQLGEATGEAAASVALQAPGLKGSWRELRLGFMWQGQGPGP